MTFEIVPATAADAGAITAVVNAAYRVEDFFKVGDRTNEAEIAALLAEETFLITSAADGSVIGSVRVSVSGGRGHFGMLSVAPATQGTGLGRALIEAAERFARDHGCTVMDLEVASPRSELPDFYRKFGYEVTARADWPEHVLHELKSPAHFIVMSKSL